MRIERVEEGTNEKRKRQGRGLIQKVRSKLTSIRMVIVFFFFFFGTANQLNLASAAKDPLRTLRCPLLHKPNRRSAPYAAPLPDWATLIQVNLFGNKSATDLSA